MILTTLDNRLENRVDSLKIRLGMLLVVSLFAIIFLYSETLLELLSSVIHRGESSHGVFVPFISAYFIWLKRKALRQIKPRFDVLGIPLLAIGLFLFFLSQNNFYLSALSFFIFLAGLFMLLMGRSFLNQILFPFCFLITMIPIPKSFYDFLAYNLRDISLNGSLRILSALGIPFFRHGYEVQLPNTNFIVILSCSGIRYLIAFTSFGLAYAYLFRKTFWGRLGVVFSSVIISMVTSICRLAVIFILTYAVSPKIAGAKPHIYISQAVFLIALFTIFWLDQHFYFRSSKTKINN